MDQLWCHISHFIGLSKNFTSPEPQEPIWMLSKSAAAMITGISMGQEICVIIRQVALNLLYWKRNLQKDICGPGWRLTRKQRTSKPDYLGPELWRGLARNVKLSEKHEWYNEKFDNARRLRGIYFIDPENKIIKETIKNARKKLETPVAPAMPCKTSKNSQHGANRGKSNEFKSKLASSLEAK